MLLLCGQEDPKHYHDAKRVIECLQRSVKTADMCIASSQHIHLFVEARHHHEHSSRVLIQIDLHVPRSPSGLIQNHPPAL